MRSVGMTLLTFAAGTLLATSGWAQGVVTYYAPAAPLPVTTAYAPVLPAAPVAAPTVAYSPVLPGAPAAAPTVAYSPVLPAAPLTTTVYSPVIPAAVPPVMAPAPLYAPAPVIYRRPVVVARPVVAPVAAAPVTVVGRPVIVSPKYYVPGQPIRNVLRAFTP